MPEGVAFSPDGRYLYVANFYDNDLWIFRVDGREVTDTRKRLALPGGPAQRRGMTKSGRRAAIPESSPIAAVAAPIPAVRCQQFVARKTTIDKAPSVSGEHCMAVG